MIVSAKHRFNSNKNVQFSEENLKSSICCHFCTSFLEHSVYRLWPTNNNFSPQNKSHKYVNRLRDLLSCRLCFHSAFRNFFTSCYVVYKSGLFTEVLRKRTRILKVAIRSSKHVEEVQVELDELFIL